MENEDIRMSADLENEDREECAERRKQVEEMIKNAQELDLCFLLDATESMKECIDMVKDKSAAMTCGIYAAYPECTLRVSFVLYRDYDDPNSDGDEGCNFTKDFSGPESTFIKALSAVSANGGNDTADDVFTGLERVARLGWASRNRLLVHICDAPCHGTQFHARSIWDNYPVGDKLGRSIANLLRQLHGHCLVTHYYFCHLNATTKKMMQEFKKAVGVDGWIVEAHVPDIQSIPEKVVAMATSTISKSMSNLSAGIPDHINVFLSKSVMQTRPTWESIRILEGQHCKYKRYGLDEMLLKVSTKQLFEIEEMGSLGVRIAKQPFSAKGTTRWPYYAMLVRPPQPDMAMVVKRFKVPLREDLGLRNVHPKCDYLSQMEVQTVAAHMGDAFNQTAGLTGVKKVEFTLISTLEVDSKVYNMEQYFDRKWIRYSSNDGFVDTGEYTATLQAFTHWTHERSNGMLMVADFEGFVKRGRGGKNYTFRLCDRTIHCLHVMRFGMKNLGEHGFKIFFKSHKCNDICLRLGLAVPYGYN